MEKALLDNVQYIRSVLKRPFLPLCPASRPSNMPILGSASEVIAGCRVCVSVARAAAVLPPACLQALEGACGGGRASLLAAALGAADLARLCAAAGAGGAALRVGGGALAAADFVAVQGTHFFESPERALAGMSAAELAQGGVPAEWAAALTRGL